MAPVSRTASTPTSCTQDTTQTSDSNFVTPHRVSNMNSTGGSGPPSATKSGWFNTNILGKPVEALNEDEFLPGGEHAGAEAEMAVEVDEDVTLDDRYLPLAFRCARHLEEIKGITLDESAQTWRMRERMKTVSVALVVCLNIGVDPPDVKKTEPCARMECWINPLTLNSQRALETIGNNLQKQYERWQPRARYRQSLDPTVEEVRRLATGLRRNARDERVLFHYNGHGVPKPTSNGEIWVFNRSYTQYIPLSLYDLQSWMGSPSIFVYDCSNAGIIVSSFEQFAEQHEREYHEQVAAHGSSADLSPPISNRNCIQLAACSATQLLPMNPELPADLFTSCLTTPIKMALRWFVMQNQGKLAPRITMDMLDKIPGQFGDRRTMLGELNWIFTAITDTIAWNTLPRSLFQKLFRQDLLVASLFRNFLLAERVMRSYDCTPVSTPQLPPTHQHPMWKAWDLAVDVSLAQLPSVSSQNTPYKASSFFEEQLTAFEVWLRFGDQHRPPPEQLPIVLQVLLSQAHRLRALDLLGRFLDLGPWAVNLALSVGIFPYVLKLLQASARELRPLLVSIWAKILSVDTSCQTDLIRDASHKYFLSVLQDDVMMPIHRTWAAFILASIVHNFRQGQQEAEQANLIAICLEHLNDPQALLRQWTTIALGRVWDNYEPGRWRGARDNAPEKLFELLKDEVPEVRAAAVFALGTFVNSCDVRTEHANSLDHTIALHLMKTAVEDGSSLVRTELVVALQHIVMAFQPNFINACRSFMEADTMSKSITSESMHAHTLSPSSTASLMKSPSPSVGLRRTPSSIQSSNSSPALDRVGLSANRSTGSLSSMSKLSSALPNVGSVYDKVYRSLEFLKSDPHHVVSSMAQVLVVYLRQRVKCKNELSRPSLTIPAPLFSEAFSTSSVPSSPAKGEGERVGASRSTPPPAGSDGLGILAKPLAGGGGGVTTIKEEEGGGGTSGSGGSDNQPQPNKSSSRGSKVQPPPPNSLTHPRLARGRSEGRHPSGQHNAHPVQPAPLAPVSRPQSQSANVSLLANTPLPVPELTTEFIPWSAKYFTKQLMRNDCVKCHNLLECDCDHESKRHWNREWMLSRNAKVRSQSEQEYALVRSNLAKIDSSLQSNLPVMRCQPKTASAIVFHPYDCMMVAAGENFVNVWNPSQGFNGKMNTIELETKHPISVSSLEMVNSHDDPVLLIGYNDGGVIVLRDFYDQNNMQMVAAWNGLRELESQRRRLQQLSPGASIIAATATARTSWCQALSTLAQASDSRIIRLWDANREMRKRDLSTEDASGAVTSLHYAPTTTSSCFLNLLVGGFTSGNIRLFDDREWGHTPALKLDDLQGCPILDAKLLDCAGQSLLLAGNAKGKVRLYDIRKPFQAIHIGSEMSLDQNISRMAIHPRCPVFASWAQQQQVVSIYAVDQNSGTCQHLNNVKHHEEGMITGLRLGPESGSLRFHPHLLQLAVASKEGAITVKGIRKTI